MRNQGSKENLGVKIKEGICAKLCLKFSLTVAGFFVISMVLKATAQKESPKQSIPKVTSEAAVRRCSSKIGVLRNFAIFTGKHLRWSLVLINLQAFI